MSFARVKVRCFAVLGSLALLLGVTLAGCSDSDPTGENVSDVGLARSLVFSLGDAADDTGAKRFESLFVEGAAPKPADRSQYGEPLVFRLQGEPEASGDNEAILTVEVLRSVPNADSEVVGEVKWTAVKAGDQWKLKSAPLP